MISVARLVGWMRRKKKKRNKHKRTKKEIKAFKKEQYFKKWCVVGAIAKLRPRRKAKKKNQWVYDPGVLAWATLEDYIRFANPRHTRGAYFHIKDHEEIYAVVLNVHNSKDTNHVMVQILLPDRVCWVRRQDLRKPKETRI